MTNLKENIAENTIIKKRSRAYFWFKILDEYLVWILIVVILIVMSLAMKSFLRPINLMYILINSTPIGIMAIAASLVFIIGKFDLSIESTLGFCAMIGGLIVTKTGINPFLAIIILLAVGAAIGFFNGICIVKLGVNPFLQTLSMLILLRGLMLFITSGVTITKLPQSYRIFGNSKLFGIPAQIFVLLVFFFMFSILLERTVFGKRLYAIGANPELAFISGIKTDRLNILVFILSGTLAAFSGLVLSTKQGAVDANLGKGLLFTVFASAVLGGVSLFGGKGRVIGALGGVLFLTTIGSLLSWIEVSAFGIDSITGGIILLAVILDATKNKLRERIII
ncbi:MAG: ABC transporter permease [Actinobacteria bacterium]|nr:ABC transporter permease [Actinomycetota bacterium]